MVYKSPISGLRSILRVRASHILFLTYQLTKPRRSALHNGQLTWHIPTPVAGCLEALYPMRWLAYLIETDSQDKVGCYWIKPRQIFVEIVGFK